MPRKTLILIIALIVLAVCLVGLSIYITPQEKKPVQEAPKTVADYAQTEIVISSSATPVSTGSGYQTNVAVSSGENRVTAIQLELTYNPDLVSDVTIEPGPFLTDPVVLLNRVNEDTGRISLALGMSPGQEPTQGEGVAAVIKFTPLAQEGTTAINFLPTTQVTAVGQNKSVLKSTQGATIDLSTLGERPLEKTEPSSPSGIM